MKETISILFLLLKIIQSCAPSTNVVSKWKFQKRKYKRGYQINLRSKFKNSKVENLLLKNEKDSNTIFYPLKYDGVFEVDDNKFKTRKTLSQIFLCILILFPTILLILIIYLLINYLINKNLLIFVNKKSVNNMYNQYQ